MSAPSTGISAGSGGVPQGSGDGAGAAGARAAPWSGLHPGLCSITLRDRPWEEVVDLAVAAGLAGVEWGADVHVPPGQLTRAGAVAERCAVAGLACASYGSYLRVGEGELTTAPAVLDTAAALGADNVRVWCRWLSASDVGVEDRRRMVVELRQVCEMAGLRGLTVSLEHHAFTLTESVNATVHLLGDVGAPNLFSYWQPCDMLAVSELLAEVDAVLPVLSHLHVFRWRSFEDRLPLTDGVDLWPAVVAAVVADRSASAPPSVDGPARRWAFLEYVRDDDPAQLLADAATLRSWLAEPG